MKKLFLSMVILITTAHLYGMQGMVGLQISKLEEIVSQYRTGDPSGQQIDAFLDQYPNGTSFQRVFSNHQKQGSLCGVYAIQNSLWYRYMMGNRNHLTLSNRPFVDLLNSIDNVQDSGLNGIETEVFEKLLASRFEPGFAIIAFQQNRYVPLNASGMVRFFGDGVGYVSDLIAGRVPVISFLINCSAGDTYGASAYNAAAAEDSIPGHWVSVTMIQNATKRVYLMADSLADERGSYDEGHTGFVLRFLNAVESGLKNRPVADEIAADFYIPANDRYDERLRKEWLHQLSPDDILVKVKRICADELEKKHIDHHIRQFVFENIINPALQGLDETATAQIVAENLRIALQGGVVDTLENSRVIYAMFDEIFARLQGDEQQLEKIGVQEKLETYQLKLQDALNQKFVDADDVVIVSNLDENRGVKEFIVSSYVVPAIEEYIDTTLGRLVADRCISFETCLNTKILSDVIAGRMRSGFGFIAEIYPSIQRDTLEEITAIIMSIIGATDSVDEVMAPMAQPIAAAAVLENAGEAQGQLGDPVVNDIFKEIFPVEAPFTFQPIVFRTGFNRILPQVSDFRFLQFQTVPPAVGMAAAQPQVNFLDEVD